MLTEIIDLLDLTRKLVTRKTELDKEYFDNFVKPIWICFQKVHEDYKKSFLAYSVELSKDNFDIDKLISKIRQDSIYTKDLRNELYAIFSSVPIRNMDTVADNYFRFGNSLRSYFCITSGIKERKNSNESGTDGLGYGVEDGSGLPSEKILNWEISNANTLPENSIIHRILKKMSPLGKLILEDDTPWVNNPRFRAIIVMSRNAG